MPERLSPRDRAAAVARSTPARLAITAILLGLLATQLDWSTALDRVRSGDPLWLAGAVLAVFTALAVAAWRWQRLLVSAELPAGPRAVLRGYFMGAFANNFLPTGFGGDAVRALTVARPGPQLARAATTVLADRLTSLACLLVLGWLVLPFDPGAVPGELVGLLAFGSAAALAGAALVWAAARSRALRARIPDRLRPIVSEMYQPLRVLAGDRPLIAQVTVLGLLYQAFILLSVWLDARAIGLELPFALIAVTVPLVLVLTLLPVSLAGFGVREGSFAVLLGTAGVSATDATLLSLTTVLTMAIASLPGAVAIVVGRGAQSDA